MYENGAIIGRYPIADPIIGATLVFNVIFTHHVQPYLL